MYRRKGKGKKVPDEAGDGLEHPGSSQHGTERPEELLSSQASKQKPKKEKIQKHKPEQKQAQEQKQQHHPLKPHQEDQPQGPWGRGPPPFGPPQQQPQAPPQQEQPQGPWGRGPPPFEPLQQQPQVPQQKKESSEIPEMSKGKGQKKHPQGPRSGGLPPFELERPGSSQQHGTEKPEELLSSQASKQKPKKEKIQKHKPEQKQAQEQKQQHHPLKPHQEDQPQGPWGRGRPPFEPPQQQPQAPPQQEQPQGPWGRGRPPFGPPQQQPQAPPQQEQPQGPWGRGPLPFGPPQQQPQAPPQQEQPQGPWGRGPLPFGPPQQQPQAPPQQEQPQGPWGRGSLPFGPPQQQPQAPPQQEQPQGFWGRGRPSFGPPQQQPQAPPQQEQPQGPWGRGPLPFGPPQQQPQVPPQQEQPQGPWGRGPLPFGPPQQQPQVPQQKKESSVTPEMSKGKGQKKDVQVKEQSPDTKEFFEFAPRIPAPKKSGRTISVFTNFFPLVIKNPDVEIHHYDVVIEPDKPKYLMRSVWNKFVSMMFPNRLVAFDEKNAYSRGPLTSDGTASATVTVLNPESNREKEFNVSIKEVRKISFSVFKNYKEHMIQGRAMKSLPEAELAVLEIILRNWMCDNLVRSNRVFFTQSSLKPKTYDLSEKLCLKIGHFQSVFLGNKPYLNFDISFKAFYKELHLLDLVNCFKNRNSGSVDFDSLNSFVRTVKVKYQIPNDPSFQRIFRVNKLVGNANSQTFKKEDGTELTVARYFETEKKYKLRHPELPLLWVGPTQKNIYIPMEFCCIAPDQIYKGVVNPFEQREMVQKATSNARERKNDVQSLFSKVRINDTPLMQEFGLKVADEMEKVNARVLEPPKLKTSRNIFVREGTWKIQDFFDPKRLIRWCILNLDNRVNKQSLMNFQQMIKTKGIEYRMEIADPSREPLIGEANFAGMKAAFSKLKDMDMVFVVISEAKGVYQRVKAICETQEGILTQCVKGRTLSQDLRKLSTTVQNILLKVNAKLGGRNHCLDRSSFPSCLNGNVMIIGADVTHPSPGMKIPSVAAVTVSCDPAAFQYGTTTRVQPKSEMIKDMEEIISINLKTFYQLRKCYPEKIIFFRDGVSEGEMPKVFKSELLALRKACQGYCQPKITFVIVQKRHHTRFFPSCPADEVGRNFNVPVGTCVDSDIVHPRDLDFYLLSHESILGTARPTRYRLLHDDNKLTDDEVETLAFYLCHLFSRCNRSVSYPSPTYNAHLAAARVRAHLEGLNLMAGQDIEDIKKKLPDHISKISPMYYV